MANEEASDGLTLAECAEVFAEGFGATRSLTYPFPARRVAPRAFLLADAPPLEAISRRYTRRPELIAWDVTPDAATEIAAGASLGSRYFLCLMVEPVERETEAIAAFKAAGYRLQRREPHFVLLVARRLGEIGDECPLRRVVDARDAEAVAKAAGARQILPRDLGGGAEASDVRLYAAFDGDSPVGWVRSIRTRPDRSWVANLFVLPEYRGRGVGRSLMRRMLDGDAEAGIRHSVLLASQAGSRLYPHLGYQRRGTCLVLCPKK